MTTTFSHAADENMSVCVRTESPRYKRERKMRKNYIRDDPDERKEAGSYDQQNERVPSLHGHPVDDEEPQSDV